MATITKIMKNPMMAINKLVTIIHVSGLLNNAIFVRFFFKDGFLQKKNREGFFRIIFRKKMGDDIIYTQDELIEATSGSVAERVNLLLKLYKNELLQGQKLRIDFSNEVQTELAYHLLNTKNWSVDWVDITVLHVQIGSFR
jgi:hypothetical protein